MYYIYYTTQWHTTVSINILRLFYGAPREDIMMLKTLISLSILGFKIIRNLINSLGSKLYLRKRMEIIIKDAQIFIGHEFLRLCLLSSSQTK